MIDATYEEPAQEGAPRVDEFKLRQLALRLESEQNLFLALLAGTGAAALSAGLWALITVVTKFQIGWMAVGVGFVVGLAVRFAGRGVHQIYGVLGAALALLGCVAGNLLAGCGFVAVENGFPFLAVLGQLKLQMALQLISVMFSPMDLLFYGIAIYEGYHLSFRRLEQPELAGLVGQPT